MKTLRTLTVFAFILATVTSYARADQVRIAVIDPASGPFAAPSLNWTKSMKLAADIVNRGKLAGPHTLDITHIDNKGAVQETAVALRSALDQGFRYIVNGGSSAAYAALLDGVNKHNARSPGKEVLLFTHSNSDPELTNEKCSFWSFRYNPHADMYAEALTTEMAKDPQLKKLYIIGQNYAFGQAVSKATRAMMKRKRPDVEIVGDELHPIGQVKDFSPYIAKIRASGAQAVTTANWGADLTLLVKSANDFGLNVPFYTYFAHSLGVATALGPNSVGRVKNISTYSPNIDGAAGREMVEGMKKVHGEDFVISGTHTFIMALASGIKKANSIDPVKVAFALEGVRFQDISGESEMRKTDHQLLTTTFLSTWAKVDGKQVKYDQENTGYGWKVERRIEPFVGALPTSCQMERPAAR